MLTALALHEARGLRIEADLAALLPDRFNSVQALSRLQQEVGAETTADVAIRSPSFEANRAFAEDFAREVKALETSGREPYVSRVEYRRDVRFVRENALYFATFDELDRLERFLQRQAQAVRANNDPLHADLIQRRNAPSRRGDREEVEALRQDLAALALSEYLVSPDSTVLAVRLYPTGSKTDIAFIDAFYAELDSLILEMRPGSYHPQMIVTPAGDLLGQSVEVRAITDDVRNSFGAGVLAVLLAVVTYFLYKTTQARTGGRFVWRVLLSEVFRTPVTAVLLSVPLLMSLSWAAGVAATLFGALNIMTSTLGLILFGLGIDYGIHFYARYAEERGSGKSVPDAIEGTFVSTGVAIAVSAITTASALFVLQVADFKGFSEFGVIGGIGIVFALVSMLTVLPALISLAERYGLLNLRYRGEASRYEPDRRFPFSRTLVVGSLVITGVCLVLLPRVRFQYDFGALEPAYPEYEAKDAELDPVFGQNTRRNPAYILLDTPEQVRSVTHALKDLAERDSLVLAVESLQERLPTDSASIGRKLNRLADIRTVLSDPFLRADTTGQVEMLRQAASVREPVPLDSVPPFITRSFTTRSGEVGNFVIVFPAGSLSDARRSLRFGELVGAVTTEQGETFYAASTSLVAADMLRLMQSESPLMIGLTFLVVMLMVAFTFRSVKWTLVALAPLVVGILWMLGTMVIGGILLTFYNLVVLPTILGVGNDAGVHIAHRYREEGRGSIRRVLRSTGEHITMGAMTNLIGFAGLLLSNHPGLRSIGVLAVVGLGTTLLAALVFFPALLQWLEDIRWFMKRRRARRRFDLGDPNRWRRPSFRLRAPNEAEEAES